MQPAVRPCGGRDGASRRHAMRETKHDGVDETVDIGVDEARVEGGPIAGRLSYTTACLPFPARSPGNVVEGGGGVERMGAVGPTGSTACVSRMGSPERGETP